MKEIRKLWKDVENKNAVNELLYKMIIHQYVKKTQGYEAWFDRVMNGTTPLKNRKKIQNGLRSYSKIVTYPVVGYMLPFNSLKIGADFIMEAQKEEYKLERNQVTPARQALIKIVELYNKKFEHLPFDLITDVCEFEKIFKKRYSNFIEGTGGRV